MRLVRARAVLLVLVFLPLDAWAVQTTTFKGRLLVTEGGPPVTQMRVNLGPTNGIAPRADGLFSAIVPAGTSSLLITVETGSDKWQAWHPRLPVAVSTDTSVVTEVLVGPSIEQQVRRLFGSQFAQLKSLLQASTGVRDSLARRILEEMQSAVAQRANLSEADLTAATDLGVKRAEVFPVLSGTIEAYLIKLQNVQLAFQYLTTPAFSSDSAFAQLKQAILAYNTALEALRTQHEGFERSVRENWDSDRLAGDYRATVDYALVEIHEVLVLPFNPAVLDIDAILKRRTRGAAATTLRDQTLARVRTFLATMEPRIAELTRRKTRLLAQLQIQ